ncbi:MAG: cell envelope biogenesis protein OmpA [Nocardioides sp.]|nr:cell envelope biogenesis protein OmpA [Nocardioides sp.]
MSAITQNSIHSTTRTSTRRSVWKHGLAASAGATVATTTLAAIASAAGVSFAGPDGSSIPLAGFAQLTLAFSLVGIVIAAVMARVARTPRRTFVRTTVALTVLSVVPDATFGFSAGSAVTLMALHAVAAVIVIPVLARRLAASR